MQCCPPSEGAEGLQVHSSTGQRTFWQSANGRGLGKEGTGCYQGIYVHVMLAHATYSTHVQYVLYLQPVVHGLYMHVQVNMYVYM